MRSNKRFRVQGSEVQGYQIADCGTAISFTARFARGAEFAKGFFFFWFPLRSRKPKTNSHARLAYLAQDGGH